MQSTIDELLVLTIKISKEASTYDQESVTGGIEMKRVYLGVLMALFFAILSLPVNAQQAATIIEQPLSPSTRPKIAIYRSESCGCCTKWGEYIEAEGFPIQDKVVKDMDAFKQANGITPELASCHTAVVEGYVVEGHVPAASINKMLDERPDIRGLTAPGMPMGSPGMETAGIKAEAFNVLAIANDGTTTIYDQIRPK